MVSHHSSSSSVRLCHYVAAVYSVQYGYCWWCSSRSWCDVIWCGCGSISGAGLLVHIHVCLSHRQTIHITLTRSFLFLLCSYLAVQSVSCCCSCRRQELSVITATSLSWYYRRSTESPRPLWGRSSLWLLRLIVLYSTKSNVCGVHSPLP